MIRFHQVDRNGNNLGRQSRAAIAGREAGKHDRLFYGGMAVAMGLTVLAGFASTYYLRFLTGGPKATLSGGPFTTLVYVHGALFTAWVLLFIVQTALVAGRRVAVHRRLGGAGAVLAAAMIVAGTFIAIATANGARRRWEWIRWPSWSFRSST